MKAGRDYKVVYVNNQKCGTATARVIGKGNYGGCLKLKFSIVFPKTKIRSLESSFHSLIVSWKKIAGATGYEISYSTHSNFKDAVSVKVSGGSTTTKRLVGLTVGANYYVRVRAFKGSIRSSWSAVKTKHVHETANIDYVNWAVAIANNNAVGYGHYWGPNPSYPVSISCAGLVGMSLTLCGYGDFRTYGKTPYDWMYWDNTQSDSVYRQKLIECGMEQLPYTGVADLKPGDILYTPQHTGIYIGNGLSVEARGSGVQWYDAHGLATGSTYADDDGQEIAIYNAGWFGWHCIFRMKG